MNEKIFENLDKITADNNTKDNLIDYIYLNSKKSNKLKNKYILSFAVLSLCLVFSVIYFYNNTVYSPDKFISSLSYINNIPSNSNSFYDKFTDKLANRINEFNNNCFIVYDKKIFIIQEASTQKTKNTTLLNEYKGKLLRRHTTVTDYDDFKDFDYFGFTGGNLYTTKTDGILMVTSGNVFMKFVYMCDIDNLNTNIDNIYKIFDIENRIIKIQIIDDDTIKDIDESNTIKSILNEIKVSKSKMQLSKINSSYKSVTIRFIIDNDMYVDFGYISSESLLYRYGLRIKVNLDEYVRLE